MHRIRSLTTAACLLLAGLSYGQAQPRAFPAPQFICDSLGVKSAEVQDLLLAPTGREPFRVSLVLGGAEHTLQLRPNDIRSTDFRVLVDGGNGLREVPASAPVTYRGEVVDDPGSSVAATLIDGQLRAELRCAGKTWSVQPVGDAQAGLLMTSHVVFQRAELLEVPYRCATQGTGSSVVPGQEMPRAAMATTLSLAELAIDADEPYYRSLGSSVTAVENDVLGILNAVDLIYNTDVGIEHEVTTIVVRTVPTYTADRASPLLDQFADRWFIDHGNIRRDVAHLFSGRNDHQTLGIAFLKSVCNNFSGYGLSMTTFSNNTINRVGLTAHELGHSWGADHCNGSSDCSIMCAQLGACTTNLSTFGNIARLSIASFKATRNCLTTIPATLTPAISTVSPSTVKSFDPGEVVISGSRFDTVSSVTVGGVSTSFTTVGSTTLLFTPPSPFDIDTHEVKITNSAGSTTTDLTVEGNHPSVVEPPAIIVTPGTPGTYSVHTDREWQALLVVSTSRVPSLIPGIVALGVGNNFSDYIAIPLLADTRGTAEINLTFPTFLPALVTYWQAVTFDPANLAFPLEVSDDVTVFVF